MRMTEEEFTSWMKAFCEGPLKEMFRQMIKEEVARAVFQMKWNVEQGLPEGI